MYSANGKYNVITVANVQGDRYIKINHLNNKVDELPVRFKDHQKLSDNDILITLIGNVGRVSLNRGNNNLLNQRVGVLDFFNNDIYYLYVFYALSTEEFRRAMTSKSKSVVRNYLPDKEVTDYIIPVPCQAEQYKIAEFFTAFDDAIECAEDELDKLRLLKQGFLQQMLL